MRFAVTVSLAFAVTACGLLPRPIHDSSPAGAMAHMGTAIPDGPYASPCVPREWVTGIIVPGKSGEAAIRDDHGFVRQLTWGPFNRAVIDWNRRYTIGGGQFLGPDTLVACGEADSVIPLP